MNLIRRLRRARPKEAPPPRRLVKVVTDSTADLPPELTSELGITVIPLQVIFPDGAYRDGVDITTDEFFRKLAQTKELPKTSQPSIGTFQQAFEALSQQTDGILSIHLSSGFSGTVQAARTAARELIGRCSIEVIDSGTVSMAMGFAAIAAARAANEGATLEECATIAKSILRRQRLAVTLDTLEYLRRGGRIGRAQAFVGGLLRLKPILTIRDGQAYPLTRARTRQRALDELLRICLEGVTIEEAVVMHATTPDEARYLHAEVERRCPDANIYRGRIGPVIGVYGGPGLIGLAVVLAEGSSV
jgi:DegV family protein with EDD domain